MGMHPLAGAGLSAPSATWTYLVNDDPFEDKFIMRFAGDIGFSVLAGLQWPLAMLYFLLKKRDKSRHRVENPTE